LGSTRNDEEPLHTCPPGSTTRSHCDCWVPHEMTKSPILREADSAPVAAVAKRHGVSEPTIYAWRKRFGSLETMDVRRLKTVEQENARLKKLLAERDLEIEVMKEIARGKF